MTTITQKVLDLNVKRIHKKLKEIRKTIDENGKYESYVNMSTNNRDPDFRFINKGNDLADFLNELLDLVKDKKELIGKYVFIIEFVVDEEFEHGPVYINFNEYKVMKTYELQQESTPINGILWYNDKDILHNMFDYGQAKLLLEIVSRNTERFIHKDNFNVLVLLSLDHKSSQLRLDRLKTIYPTPAESKKIKHNLQKIRNMINKNGKFAYWLLIDDQIKLVSKGNDLKNLTEQTFLKIAKRKDTRGKTIYLTEIRINERYVDNPSVIVAGPLTIWVTKYVINNKYHVQIDHRDSGGQGNASYSNDDILLNGFHFTDIKKLLHIIDSKKLLIVPMTKPNAIFIIENKY